MEYRAILDSLSDTERVRNKRWVQKIRKNPPPALDEKVRLAEEHAFQKVDCMSCANCCRTTSPILYRRDIERLSSRLRVKPGDFTATYLRVDEDRDYVFKSAPCPFLQEDNSCGVYEDRPQSCRDYPHLNRRKFHEVAALAIPNSEICPAVVLALRELTVAGL